MQTSGFHKYIQYKSISESYLRLGHAFALTMRRCDCPTERRILTNLNKLPSAVHEHITHAMCDNVSPFFCPQRLAPAIGLCILVGFLKAYQSLLSETAWIMPKCKPNSADFLFRELEIISKIPKLPPSYGGPWH